MNIESLNRRTKIDRICGDFETLWDVHQASLIEQTLAENVSVPHDELLYELLLLEFEFRQNAGQHFSVEDYLARFVDKNNVIVAAVAEAGLTLTEDDVTVQLVNYETNQAEPSTTGHEFPNSDHCPTLPHAEDYVPRVADPVRRIGEYLILEVIGEGGMGVVYKARHEKLNRLVAIKVIRSGIMATDEERQRFQIEANAAGRLKHPNIIGVYDFGSYAGGHFLVMPLVTGKTLTKRIGQGTFAVDDAAALVSAIADAVHYAHSNDIIHRDLKPANVIMEGDKPLLTDFGLARDLLTDQHLTMTGQIMGTPQFMSPEQARGGSDPIDARSDVYSLGAILYYVLLGRPPFQAAKASNVLSKVICDEPVPLRSIDESIHRDLQTICLKALRKSAEDRYQTAAEMADDLRRYIERRPILARPLPLPVRMAKWCRRKPIATGVIAAGILVCTAAMAAAGVFKVQKEKLEVLRADMQDANQFTTAHQMRSALTIAVQALENHQIGGFEEAFRGLLPQTFGMDCRFYQEQSEKKLKASRKFVGGYWSMFDCAIDTSRTKLVTADQGGVVCVWNLETGDLQEKIQSGVRNPMRAREVAYFKFYNQVFPQLEKPRFVFSVDWIDDQNFLMACDDGSIVKIDAMTTVESQVCKLDSPSWLLRTRRDTQQFVSINESAVMRLHDPNGVVEAQHSMKAGVPTVLKQSEKTGHWFVGTTDGRIEWFDENLKPVDKIELRDEVTDLQIVIDGSVTRILAASRGRNIYEITLASDHSVVSTSRVRIDSRSRTSYSNLSVDTSRLYALNYDGELTIARRNDNQIRLTQQIGGKVRRVAIAKKLRKTGSRTAS